VVSLGPKPKELLMEDLVDLDQKVAVSFLTGLGIEENKILIRTENSTTIAAGKVTRTDPVEGETITKDQTISIWVSLGPEMQERTLPNVQGMDLELALSILERNGFKNVLTEPVESSKTKDTVISQSHTPFIKLDVTTEIILQVSIGMNDNTTPPPEIEFKPILSQIIEVMLPGEILGEYTVTLKIGDEVVQTRQILPGTVSTEFEITGEEEGTVEYEIWVQDNFYTKGSVELTADE